MTNSYRTGVMAMVLLGTRAEVSLLAAPSPSSGSLPGSLPWVWVALGLLGLVALLTAALWWRSRQALALAEATFAAVANSPDNASVLPTTGAFKTVGSGLNRALNRLRSSQARALLHDQALATLQPERILEAAARQAEAIATADGLHVGAITCVRFYNDRARLAQSHSRLPDGTREMVILAMAEPKQLEAIGAQALRLTRDQPLPDYLANLEPVWEAGHTTHLDLIPLLVEPGGIGTSTQVLGVLVLGSTEADAPPLRFDSAPTVLNLARSIAHALATCQRKLAAEQLASDSLTALARTADATSTYTRGHSERVAQLALRVGKSLGLVPSELDNLRRAALLHDLGSTAISHRLLDQEDAYDEEQRSMMRPHIELGLSILEPLGSFSEVLPIIAQHHEWWNGEGYPNGLQGEDIDLLARILTVVDVYEALTSTRPYRRALDSDRALAHLEERAGQQFEPRVVGALAKDIRKSLGEQISAR